MIFKNLKLSCLTFTQLSGNFYVDTPNIPQSVVYCANIDFPQGKWIFRQYGASQTPFLAPAAAGILLFLAPRPQSCEAQTKQNKQNKKSPWQRTNAMRRETPRLAMVQIIESLFCQSAPKRASLGRFDQTDWSSSGSFYGGQVRGGLSNKGYDSLEGCSGLPLLAHCTRFVIMLNSSRH